MTEATIPTTEPAVESQVADDTEAEAVVQASTEEEPKETEELSEEPVQTPKASASKRRSIFNPFGKSKEEVEAIPTESIENKKKAKGFGSFFSRSKSAPKVNEDVHAELAPVPTELPQIEKLQPIETVDVTEDANNSEQVLESKKTESEPEATEAHAEEQVEAQLNIPTTNKRQSFISKIFSGNS
ncbi:hypothetical protein G6F56_012612 [Rhizopus delemar]|nr:hypothetical protein G6F56_012612 [Rhizopus delemar]